ncbi:MAG: hypothetical protein A2281_12930 [Bacteroidetes bacterium RIFOXYA12_FULL_38_20]|nr:MAG: hypothetical protein A2281_12930 [Bacteroidetes bacterium RIFOXYA12_FULL_38_20]
MKKFILFVLVAAFSGTLSAQQWLQPEYFKPADPLNVSFYDIQNAFKLWSEGKDISDLKGWKRYKRWEWFYGQRMDENGFLPDPSINWKEWERFNRNFPKNRDQYKTANWVSIAPTSLPPSPEATSIHGMGRINCMTFHPTDDSIMFIGASQGGVWKTTDDGNTWTCLTDDAPIMRVSAIAVDPSNPDIIYVATGDIDYIGFPTIQQGRITQYGVGIIKTTDGGETWNTTGLSFELTDEDNSLIRAIIVDPSNSNHLMAGGPCGIHVSNDGGATWTKTSDKLYIDIEPNPTNKNTIYASTFYNSADLVSKRIYKSIDFGNTWNELETGIPSTVIRIELAAAPSDTNIVYAIATNSSGALHAFYKTTNGGTSWTEMATEPNVMGWADGGEFADVTGFDDNAGQGDYDLTLIVHPTNASKVYSGGVNMWGSSNGGTTWDLVSMWIKVFGESIHADQHCSAFNPLTGHFYQGTDGGIYKTEDLQIGNLDLTWLMMNGCITFPIPDDADEIEDVIIPGCYELPTTWTYKSAGVHNTEYYRLGLSRSVADMVIGGSQDNGTHLYKEGNWVNTLGGDGMECMISHTDPNIIYATNYNGALSKSIDGGVNYVSGLDSAITQGAGETGDWVTPFVMHPTAPDTIYTAFNNVWRSGDGGATWEQLGDIANSNSFRALAVAPANTKYIYAYRPGTMLRTKNGGGTWEGVSAGLPISSQKLTYIAVDETNPEKVWVTFSGYADGNKVYLSLNAGDTWTNISSNLPNISANTIACEYGGYTGALYVGTDIGVFYTNDSIQTANPSAYWISYSEGLPNVVVNELEIHYGAQKLRAATYGRGFWETDLYVYENGITQLGDNDAITIYPNPNDGKFMIKGEVNTTKNVNITIFSATGNKILTLTSPNGKISREIDLSGFANGTYIVQVEFNNTHYTKKIIKK